MVKTKLKEINTEKITKVTPEEVYRLFEKRKIKVTPGNLPSRLEK